jgi:Protein of unknown function (DUF1207)
MKVTGVRSRCVLGVGLLVVALSIPQVVSASDEFIAGYASAILEHEFDVTDATVEVHNGAIVVTTKTLGNVDRGKMRTALQEIPGVSGVEIRTAEPSSTSVTEGVQVTIPQSHSKWLPRGALFVPLHADPRWPHFFASYRQFTKGMNEDALFSANFGETFAIYRNRAIFGGEWEFSIQAGVFSIFNLNTSSFDLVNADYRFGLMGSYRNGRFSAFTRLQHQSSHLGDEFLIDNPGVTRLDISYEELDLKLSYDVYSWLRIYGGGGVLVHRQPDILGRGTTQWGVELVSARTFLDGRLRPVAYADFQCLERSNWAVGESIMAGVRFENALIGDRQVQVLAEYYNGPSPDGQFFLQRVTWYGIGLHLYF